MQRWACVCVSVCDQYLSLVQHGRTHFHLSFSQISTSAEKLPTSAVTRLIVLTWLAAMSASAMLGTPTPAVTVQTAQVRNVHFFGSTLFRLMWISCCARSLLRSQNNMFNRILTVKADLPQQVQQKKNRRAKEMSIKWWSGHTHTVLKTVLWVSVLVRLSSLNWESMRGAACDWIQMALQSLPTPVN